MAGRLAAARSLRSRASFSRASLAAASLAAASAASWSLLPSQRAPPPPRRRAPGLPGGAFAASARSPSRRALRPRAPAWPARPRPGTSPAQLLAHLVRGAVGRLARDALRRQLIAQRRLARRRDAAQLASSCPCWPRLAAARGSWAALGRLARSSPAPRSRASLPPARPPAGLPPAPAARADLGRPRRHRCVSLSHGCHAPTPYAQSAITAVAAMTISTPIATAVRFTHRPSAPERGGARSSWSGSLAWPAGRFQGS
jgi:hypothetical protein